MSKHLNKGLAWSTRFALLLMSLLIVILDQITKMIARNNLQLFQQKHVLPFWNWTLAYNQGAAFSLFADQGGWQRIFFGVLAVGVSVGLVFYILNKVYSKITGVAICFILGGAIGNLVDRIMFGQVTDFIDWYYSTHHWPAFNVADSFITVGVTLMIIESIFFSNKKNSEQ